jgi:hypothetical protein
MPNRLPLLLVLAGLLAGVLPAGTDSAQLPYRAWNGHWWPFVDAAMVTGRAHKPYGDPPIPYEDWEGFFAPMDKYNLALGEQPRFDLWAWELANHGTPEDPEDPDWASWYGHCNGWAAAAALETEPVVPGEYNAVYLRVGDKKAFLTEAHQGDASRVFPEDPDVEPISAVLFHTKLVEYIKTLVKPIIIETSPGDQVWNYPCYRYDMTWTDAGGTRQVTTQVYLGRDFEHPDTTADFIRVVTYEYDLQMDGEVITGGAWRGTNRPHFMWEPVARNSANPYLDYDQARLMVDSVLPATPTDDAREDNDTRATAATVNDPVFFGRLLDADYFRLPVEAGEAADVAVHVEKLNKTVTSSLTDSLGVPVGTSEVVDNYKVFHAGKQYEDRDLYLGLVPAAPQTNFRNYGFEVTRNSLSFFMPHLANADGWDTRIAVVNQAAEPAEVFFHFYRTTEAGYEKQHFPATLTTLEGGGFRMGPLESFFPDITPDNARWLRIRSDRALSGVFLFANEAFGGNLAAVSLVPAGARTLYFNHLAVDDTWWTGISIVNPDLAYPARVDLQPFRPDGLAIGDPLQLDIAPGCRYINMLGAAFPPETLAEAGWIQIDADREVAGFELFGTNDLSLFEGVPLQSEGQTTLYTAHLPAETGWWTGISVVNPNPGSTEVRITPYNASGLNAYTSTPTPYYYSAQLGGYSKFVTLVDQIFPNPPRGPVVWLKIEAVPARPVLGFVLYGNFDLGILCGYPLAGAVELRHQGIAPWLDGTRLVFSNAAGANTASVSVAACDAGGAILATASAGSVSIRTMKRLDPVSLFGGALPAGTAFLRWTASKDIHVWQEVLEEGQGTILNPLDFE